MQAQRRFTDRDVRQDENLLGVARDWLEQYSGEFDFLIDAQQVLRSGGDLTIPLARAVLNCMRSDPFGSQLLSNLPEPERPTLVAVPARRWHEREPRSEESDPIASVSPIRYPRVLRTTFKGEYLLSTWPTAQVAHLLRQTSRSGSYLLGSRMMWYPSGGYRLVVLKAWCSYSRTITNLEESLARGDDLGVLIANSPRGRRVCNQCEFIRDEAIRRAAAKREVADGQ